jgi:hypothetical protein
MKLITSSGTRKFSELAEELLNSKSSKTPAETKEVAAKLTAANPHLANSTVLPSGTPLIVPDEVAGSSPELLNPGNQAALAAARQLHEMIPKIREALSAAYAEGKVQQREFSDRLHHAVGSEQGTKGAKTASRLKAIGEAAAATEAEAEKNRDLQAQSLSAITRDLGRFLERHSPTPPLDSR